MQIQRADEAVFMLWQPRIAELFDASVKINFPGFAVSDSYGSDKCDEVASYIKDGSAIVFLAVEQDKLAGWIWCHQIQRLSERRLHIAEIAVAEDFRRHGIGNALLNTVEEWARKNGYAEIDLLVTAGNSGAIGFYEQASYTPERFLMKKTIKRESDAQNMEN